jgi:PAS domain-containing protein
MGSSDPPLRKQEVTRKVCLAPPDAIDRRRSATPHQEQSVVWDGPIKALFGYSLEDVEDTEDWWLDRIHPEDCGDVLECLARHLMPAPVRPFAAESRIWGHDYRFRNADGCYILVSDRSTTTRDERGNATCLESVIFDKQAHQLEREKHAKLFESQDHLALIANNTPSGIFMLDPQVCAISLETAHTDAMIKGYCTYMNTAGR